MKRPGIRLRELRQARELSQGRLAQMVKVHRSYITRLEQGERLPGRELLFRLARTFGVRAEELLPDRPERRHEG